MWFNLLVYVFVDKGVNLSFWILLVWEFRLVLKILFLGVVVVVLLIFNLYNLKFCNCFVGVMIGEGWGEVLLGVEL